jgi:hypothetical protein
MTANAAEQMSIAQIAVLTNTSQKTIRAYLRANHARSLELKNSRWGDAKKGYILSKTLTNELMVRYTKLDESRQAKDNSTKVS